jgi:tRNA-modifying protein YgfZ
MTESTPTSQQLAAYGAARQAAALADLGACGWLRVTGPDRLDFVQRLSTNDLRPLERGQGLPTVLTNPLGRIIALITVYAHVDVLYLRSAPGQAAAVKRYLMNMIFYNDHVQVEDAGPEVAHFALFGPKGADVLAGLFDLHETKPVAWLPTAPYSWAQVRLAGVPLMLQRGGPLDRAAWLLVVPLASALSLWQTLAGLLPVLDAETQEVLRVEAGLPAWDHELNDQVTPLEAGLLSAISYSKGCYTGQEIIARQTNYDKVTRRLAGLLLPTGAGDGPDLRGAAVTVAAGGRGSGRAGFVGSAVHSPALGQSIALAVVPRDASEPGSRVTIRLGEQEFIATVTGLPFVRSDEP